MKRAAHSNFYPGRKIGSLTHIQINNTIKKSLPPLALTHRPIKIFHLEPQPTWSVGKRRAVFPAAAKSLKSNRLNLNSFFIHMRAREAHAAQHLPIQRWPTENAPPNPQRKGAWVCIFCLDVRALRENSLARGWALNKHTAPASRKLIICSFSPLSDSHSSMDFDAAYKSAGTCFHRHRLF